MRTSAYQRTSGEWVTEVVLSRRNLLALLAKLDGHPPESKCTLGSPSMYVPVLVRAEEDDLHYAHESREGVPPGRLHEETAAHMGVEANLGG